MIDRKQIERTFRDYVSNYNMEDTKVRLKVVHTYHVARLCEQIAGSLELPEADIDVAWLSGMLHDIGRFEQLRRYNTFVDRVSVNHAALSADLLFREGLIREFTAEGVIDEVMMDAVIRFHNALALPADQDERTRMFSDILRDADKIDILRVNCETPRTEILNLPEEAFTQSEITDAVLEDVMNERNVDRRNSRTGVDFVLGHLALVFGLVYPESIRQVQEQGYLRQLLDFRSQNPDTQVKLEQVREKLRVYMERRTADINKYS